MNRVFIERTSGRILLCTMMTAHTAAPPVLPIPSIPPLLHNIPPVPQPPQGPLTQPNPPVPVPPPQNDQEITIVNPTAFPASVRFETHDNPGIIDSVPAHSNKKIHYKPGSVLMYSIEESASIPLTPDMISNNIATLKAPLAPPSPPAQSTHQLPMAQTQAFKGRVPAPSQAAQSTTSALGMPQQSLPPAASSQGPPGYKTSQSQQYPYLTMPDKPRG